MLRVGLVCPYSVTIPGGVQGQVLGLARVLRGRGVEARVLAPCDGAPPEVFVTPLGNSLPTAANGSMAPLAPDPACSLRTMRALVDEGFDVLHLHEPLAPGPTITTLVLHSAPILGTFHAAGDSTSYRVLNGPINWVADRIDLRVAVSDDAKSLARRYVPGDYEVLWNGVDVERYRAAAPRRSEHPTIFFCGRHEPRKGLSVLLQAMRDLPPAVRLSVASDGPETAALRAEHGDDARVSWLGRLTDEEKMAHLAGADVFCAPSLHGESFGVVLIEAMAAHTPVVASDIPGYRNVARDGVDALLVPPGDVGSLADALRAVLTDVDLAKRLREGGAARAERFSMESLADAYIARYERLVAEHPPGSSPRPGLLDRILG
jgi:phosphatidylinositol alpha-mannosyltransferase